METRTSHRFLNSYGTKNYLCDKILYPSQHPFGFPPLLDCPQNAPANLDFEPLNVYKPGKFQGVHFFIDDHLQNRLWNRPAYYVPKLQSAHTIFSPDFSPYTDYPEALQIFQFYRSRYLTRFYQEHGCNVIPYVSFNSPKFWDACFEGVPPGLMLSGATQGRDKGLTLEGYQEISNRLAPAAFYVYGLKWQPEILDIFKCPVYFLPTFWDKKRNNGKGSK